MKKKLGKLKPKKTVELSKTLSIISLFSGAGGMDIGFQEAGFSTAVLLEHDSSCCDTLRKNMPNTPILEGDIRTITSQQILSAANLKVLEASLVIGGPPCQSFSLAGKRMGMNDPRGMLVLEFIRVVRETLPIGFVMENVKGMLNWANGAALTAILEEARQPITYKGCTYKYDVSFKVINGVDYGVPQHRERVFIVGNRISKKFSFPEATHSETHSEKQVDFLKRPTLPYMTVKNAIGALPPALPPSEAAIRISKTIKDRIKKHGY